MEDKDNCHCEASLLNGSRKYLIDGLGHASGLFDFHNQTAFINGDLFKILEVSKLLNTEIEIKLEYNGENPYMKGKIIEICV